jgi:hypothetical protein
MILGAIDSNLLFYLIAAIIGLISWLTKKGGHTPTDSAPSPKFPRPAGSTSQKQPSEDERLRKFLEALGVPADQRPPAPVQRRQAPVAPKQAPPERPVFVPPLPAERPAAELRRTPPPIARPVLPEERALDEAPAPVLAVEKIHLPELSTAPMAEFVTASSTVTAIPFGSMAVSSTEPDAYLGAHGRAENAAGNRVAALLKSAPDLRAAIILREILGRPPGLQTRTSLPTFP